MKRQKSGMDLEAGFPRFQRITKKRTSFPLVRQLVDKVNKLSSKAEAFDDLEERNEEEARPFSLAILRNRGQRKCKEA
jgi:hypothetical protein